MQYTRLFFLILFVASLFVLACESSSSEEEIVEVNPHERSESIYQQACASCHGVEVAAFADRKWEYGSEKDSIIEVITNGIPDEEMPGYESDYSAGAIDSLASYILTIKEKVDAYQFKGETDTSGVFAADAYDLRLDTVITDLNSPWGMAFLPDGDLLVTDKSGKLYRVTADGEKLEIPGVPEVLYEGQGGLFEVLLHPDFEENHWLYLSYSISKKEGDEVLASTAVARATMDGNQLIDVEKIFEATPFFTTRHHYGGRMEFASDGKLYISVGDRGKRDENPQSLDRYPGKIHRINEDGSIPEDNPFVN